MTNQSTAKRIKSGIYHLRVTYLERIRHDLKILFKPTKKPVVNFLVCGVQRGGTTALDHYLRQHSQICMASKKEVHYFDIEYNFRYDNIFYSKYHSFFDPQPEHNIVGEATPLYIYWRYATRRIWEYNPKMKLIILLRNPIQRAYSHWNLNRERGDENLPFWEAIHIEEERKQQTRPYQDRTFSYLDRGFYSEQLRRISSYFSAEQILLIKSEDLEDTPQSEANRVFKFLNVTQYKIQEKKKINAEKYQKEMTSREKNYLNDFYSLEIQTLEKTLGWDLSDWNK